MPPPLYMFPIHSSAYVFSYSITFYSSSRKGVKTCVSGPWWMEKRELTPTRSAPERGLPLSPIQSTEITWFAFVSVSISIRTSYASTRFKITVLIMNSINVSTSCTKSHHAAQSLTRDQSCWTVNGSVLYKIGFGFAFLLTVQLWPLYGRLKC